VATSATIRRSEPLLTVPAITWPRPAAILDADGAPLTVVDVVGPARGGRILLGDVDEPTALLDYCFGHGCRRVMLSLGDAPVDGWLGTSWEGSRRSWWIEVPGSEG
jgi:hypothetical protein